MSRKILIATGGTGGHIFPAEAAANEIMKRDPDCTILFAGGGLSANEYFDGDNFSCRDIPCSTFSSKTFVQKVQGGVEIWKGFWRSRNILNEFNPDLVVGFGSYHTLPILAAAVTKSIPIILHEANAVPGKVNKLFSSRSLATGVFFPEALDHLNGPAVEVGMPIREGFMNAFASKYTALEYFGFEEERFTILIFGGSQGAMTVNTKLSSTVMDIAYRTKNFQVLHFTGSDIATEEVSRLYKELDIPAYVTTFEHGALQTYVWGVLEHRR